MHPCVPTSTRCVKFDFCFFITIISAQNHSLLERPLLSVDTLLALYGSGVSRYFNHIVNPTSFWTALIYLPFEGRENHQVTPPIQGETKAVSDSYWLRTHPVPSDFPCQERGVSFEWFPRSWHTALLQLCWRHFCIKLHVNFEPGYLENTKLYQLKGFQVSTSVLGRRIIII